MAYAILAFMHLVVAGLTTSHVLLNKSEVRSAIGWIGLVWLSPFFGAMIYATFGINRVARRASRNARDQISAARSPDVTPFDISKLEDNARVLARVGTEVSGLPLTHGNEIGILQGGEQAYPEMLGMIAGAKNSIALSSYIFRPDRIGAAFVEALTAARTRGVDIRVLVDGIGSGYFSSPVVRMLRHADIPVARFMHSRFPWRMPFINLRNHKKILVVDGMHGFTGGLNLGVENTWKKRGKTGVDDTHFRVRGPAVAQIMQSFADDWHYTTGEMLKGPAWWPEIESAGAAVVRGISSGPDETVGKIESIFSAAIGQARHHVRIVTPYFLPDEQIMAAIGLAILRGVKIELIIPSRSDHRLLDWAMHAHLAFFPVDRMHCFASRAPFDHSKLASIDGHWCAVGSVNWDVRSLRLNFEFVLECYDEPTISAVDALIDEKIQHSVRLTSRQLDQRSHAAKLRDAAARLFLPYL